jgi:hypothetical protein
MFRWGKSYCALQKESYCQAIPQKEEKTNEIKNKKE